jgi:NADH dehydrogenase
LATKLGNRLGRKGLVDVTLIDKARTHVWKPKLHEIAAGSMDVGRHELNYLAQAHWHHFHYRLGEMNGLDRARKLIHVAPFIDEDGVAVTTQRSFAYDTLVVAVGSRSNDFGTPGVDEHALKLETLVDAERFHRRMLFHF